MSARWLRAAAVLAGLGATLGVALDGIHTHFGATAYTRPVVWSMAWWVPLLFAGGFTIGLSRPLLERALGAVAPPPSWRATVLAMELFVWAYWVSVLPLPWPVVAAIIGALFAVGWWTCDRSKVGLGIALAAGVGGPTVEAVLVSRGCFVHLQTVAFGVPGWLPFLYLTAGVALCTLAKRLVDG